MTKDEILAEVRKVIEGAGLPVAYVMKSEDMLEGLEKVKPITPKNLMIGKALVVYTLGNGLITYVYKRTATREFSVYTTTPHGEVKVGFSFGGEVKGKTPEEDAIIWEAGCSVANGVPREFVEQLVTALPREINRIRELLTEKSEKVEVVRR